MYEPKAVITSIKATSRASVKIKDSYFTVEYTEERAIPDLDGKVKSVKAKVDIEQEREALWNAVNAECDNQIETIIKSYR